MSKGLLFPQLHFGFMLKKELSSRILFICLEKGNSLDLQKIPLQKLLSSCKMRVAKPVPQEGTGSVAVIGKNQQMDSALAFPKPVKQLKIPAYKRLTPEERAQKIKQYKEKKRKRELKLRRILRVRMEKANKISPLKKKVWRLFSEFIRLRDCKATTGTFELGKCVTCGRECEFKLLQAGHFIPGRGGMVLFDERQVHIQCYHCNVGLKGNWPEYYLFMVNKYGVSFVEQLIHESKGIKKWTADDLRSLITHYTAQIVQIKNGSS